MLLLVVLACRSQSSDPGKGAVHEEEPEDTGPAPEPVTFPTPWEGLEATNEAWGAFEVEIGDELPGTGWYHTDRRTWWGVEACWADVSRPEGAAADVVSVVVVGRQTDGGWLVLELDFAAPSLAEGDVALDGTSAAGVLSEVADGVATPVAYAVGGTIAIEDAGTSDGEDLTGSFEELQLAEVAQ